MIQFNLLPDVKLQYIKAQRSRRLVLAGSVLACAASIVLLGLLLSVDGLQKKHLDDLNRDITSETSTLQNKPNINTILTVQNQLESLTTLHNGKPAADRLFNYLNELTPASISINSLDIDYTQYTVTLSGTTDTLADVNQYVDTLKLTAYTSGNSSTTSPAFSNVVLSGFSLDTSSTDNSQPATYSLTFSYDKNIFDITQNIKLSVPNVVTRAQVQDPTDLFKEPGTSSTTGGN